MKFRKFSLAKAVIIFEQCNVKGQIIGASKHDLDISSYFEVMPRLHYYPK
jgi:hypothetical protein